MNLAKDILYNFLKVIGLAFIIGIIKYILIPLIIVISLIFVWAFFKRKKN